MTKPDYGLCVDASYLPKKQILEFRGILLHENNRIVFSEKINTKATNNIGEFLAIYYAIKYLYDNKIKMPVYSDSITAISWIRKKHVNTTFTDDNSNKIFELIYQALEFLYTNDIDTEIIRWKTKQWGEIPADYGRK